MAGCRLPGIDEGTVRAVSFGNAPQSFMSGLSHTVRSTPSTLGPLSRTSIGERAGEDALLVRATLAECFLFAFFCAPVELIILSLS